jgi:hypothetical protein
MSLSYAHRVAGIASGRDQIQERLESAPSYRRYGNFRKGPKDRHADSELDFAGATRKYSLDATQERTPRTGSR